MAELPRPPVTPTTGPVLVAALDSSGLAVLVELNRLSTANDTAFVVTGANTRTRQLLAITRLDTVLRIE